jgi:hypothetical protein
MQSTLRDTFLVPQPRNSLDLERSPRRSANYEISPDDGMTRVSKPVIRPGITREEMEKRLFETSRAIRARDSVE